MMARRGRDRSGGSLFCFVRNFPTFSSGANSTSATINVTDHIKFRFYRGFFISCAEYNPCRTCRIAGILFGTLSARIGWFAPLPLLIRLEFTHKIRSAEQGIYTVLLRGSRKMNAFTRNSNICLSLSFCFGFSSLSNDKRSTSSSDFSVKPRRLGFFLFSHFLLSILFLVSKELRIMF